MKPTMHAMFYGGSPKQPLVATEVAMPRPARHEMLIRVHACGVCRTDLHVVDGELQHPKLPLIVGHEIVGTVVEKGGEVEQFAIGDRVGIPWLGWTCGECAYCRSGRENLCDRARFTGYQIDGGYAEFTVADHRFCFAIPAAFADAEAAPLLCAGLIGYRALNMAGDAKRIGLYGFGAAATSLPKWPNTKDARFMPSRGRAMPPPNLSRNRSAPSGRRFRQAGARAARCGADLRARRRAGAGRLEGDGQRRHRGLRRHSHERHTELPL